MQKGTVSAGVSLGLLAALGLACGGEPTSQPPLEPSEVSERASAQTQAVVGGLLDATASIDETASLSLALGTLDRLGGSCNAEAADPFAGSDDDPSPVEVLERALAELDDFMTTQVFRPELVESEADGAIVYRVDPLEACDGDAECIRDLTDHPLRFRATGTESDLSVAVLVGDEQAQPLTIEISADRIAVAGDLAELKRVLETVVERPPELPDVMQGAVELSIERHAESDFSLSWSVPRAVEVASDSGDEGLVRIRIGASRPTTTARFNSAEGRFSLSQNLAPVDVSVPGRWLCGDDSGPCGDAERQGQYEVHAGGLNGALEVEADQPERLLLSDVGLGDETSTLTLGGGTFAEIDVNPNAGRRFTMEFVEVEEGLSVRFEPSLNLAVAVRMLELSDSMQADMPSWLMDEVFDVSLGGASRSSVLVRQPSRCPGASSSAEDAELQVSEGSLTFRGSSMSSEVRVPEGQCLVGADDPVSEHPFEQLAAGSCSVSAP